MNIISGPFCHTKAKSQIAPFGHFKWLSAVPSVSLQPRAAEC